MRRDKATDAKLVEQYQKGNIKAMAELVKRWHLIFCEKAFWLVKDADIAKDIAQESWTTIMRKIEQLKDPNAFSSWAKRIVYTKALDHIRRHAKHQTALRSYHYEQATLLNSEIKLEDQSHKLLRAVKTLSENQQLILHLYYVQEYTIRDIAAHLEISVGTVKSRLFYARERLKTLL